VVDATLLKPLPYADPDRLVVVMEGSPKTGREGLVAPRVDPVIAIRTD
jgi:hypothetical protein